MKNNISSLPTNQTERQEILKQAFLLSKSGSIKDIYATAQKICTNKKERITIPFMQRQR